MQISWDRRKKGDILNDCLVSVDGIDCLIPNNGRKFFTHKWKFYGGICYEVAICILSGEIVAVNGPYEPGVWNDLSVFRNVTLSMLEEGERVEADDIYRGESPRYVKCPKSIGHQQELTDEMQSLVRHRQETANKRLKQWQCIKQLHRGDIAHHGRYFRAVAVITEVCIENGEPLFSVEYEDPDMDNFYFEVDDDLENDPDE